MDRESARQEIRRMINCRDYLQKSKSGLFCCPYCGSGTGKNGTGAVKVYDDNTWYCHACDKGGDVIDLFMQGQGLTFNEALSLLAEELGITIDEYHPKKAAQTAEKTDPEVPADYVAYYEECRKRLHDPAAAEYLRGRGISLETAEAYWIGYDPVADPAQSNHPCPRIIIPTSREHYIGRRIDGEKSFAKMNVKGSTPGIFNEQALYAQDVQEVFVCEGAFDALSILEAGYPAVALNSAANARILLNLLEQTNTNKTLILCPDNDPDEKTAAHVRKQFDELASGLQRLNIAHFTADINCGYKDANEALKADKKAFFEGLKQAQRMTSARPDNTQYYIDSLMSGEIERFKDDKKTGFDNLDRKAGGLYPGLYVLAAISSLGKTSFALQLADQLAAGGSDVIFFSLEMSRLELVTKSISRNTVVIDPQGGLNMSEAVPSISIRRGHKAPQIDRAIKRYRAEVGERVSIVEGNFNCNISFVRDYVRGYIQRTGTSPVVIIDYLQILRPSEENIRQSTKDIVDTAVTELKRLSRELDITIMAISSVNRANYLTPIDFESLKESGGIEFGCDVVWGLQLQCLNNEIFDKEGNIKGKRELVKNAKAADPRKIELVCLKNRYGIANFTCSFDYYPANDLFIESGSAEPWSAGVDWKSVGKV